MTFSQEEAVPPRLDVNVPDLYIPSMAFVTYILLAGVCLGTRNQLENAHPFQLFFRCVYSCSVQIHARAFGNRWQ